MDAPKKNIVPFTEKTKYEIGAVTYDVTAHFYDDEETIKSKINSLLINDVNKSKTPNVLACSHDNKV